MDVLESVNEEGFGWEASNSVSSASYSNSNNASAVEENVGAQTNDGQPTIESEREHDVDVARDEGDGKEVEEEVDVPVDGMTFGSLQDVNEALQQYAKSKGFGFVKFSNNKRKDGTLTNQLYACHRAGKRKPQGRQERRRTVQRVGCPVRVGAGLKKDGRWKLQNVKLEHNHELNPSNSRFIRQHRPKQSMAPRRVEYLEEEVVRPNCCVEGMTSGLVGDGNRPCLISCCDSNAVHQLLLKMQRIDHDFFYDIETDKDGRLTKLLWVDARGCAACKEFCDVITFDTTYLLKKYKLPLVTFVGVNHHGHPILLGCGLILKQDDATFEWLFKTWMRAMGSVVPGAIITDECQSISNAIGRVFPEVKHRWCLRHLLIKFSDKVRTYRRYDDLLNVFKEVVYESMTIDEFEGNWQAMVMQFSLEGSGEGWDWFKNLYAERKKWAPVFVKNHFWAGMSLTQKSESMRSYFDGFVHNKMTIRAFVEQYENVLADKIEKEVAADAECMLAMLPCRTRFAMEVQFQKAYTHNIFKKVQDKISEMIYCEVDLVSESGSMFEYKVTEVEEFDGGISRSRDFTVMFDASDIEVRCICNMFTWKGLLCRHAMKVLHKRRVLVLPEKYIISRWRKDVKRSYGKIKLVGLGGRCNQEVKRRHRLEGRFYEVVDFAIESDEKCAHFEGMMKKLRRKFDDES